jgi:hypothetical protein
VRQVQKKPRTQNVSQDKDGARAGTDEQCGGHENARIRESMPVSLIKKLKGIAYIVLYLLVDSPNE